MRTAVLLRARPWTVLVVSAAGLTSGFGLRLLGAGTAASLVWAATSIIGAGLSAWWVLQAARHRRLGVDLIALLALAGTLVVGEHLAGAVITVMLASGRGLETWAAGRAERELHALLSRAPHTAHRYVDGELTQPPLADVVVGDLLLVQPGEVVPVDGTVRSSSAVVDESALTGEALPVGRQRGETVRAGAVNAGGPFDLLATTTAADSTYAGIVRLVSEATATTSPLVRTADRFALAFVGVTVVAAAVAWALAGTLSRAVAVLVVATPCPLILAAPVAIVSGLSRAARRGVVVKGGGALEALANAEVLLFDKTGTVTRGRPAVADIVLAPGGPVGGAGEVLRLAASLDQVSPHVLASAIVLAAEERGVPLTLPSDVEEVAGLGVRGTVSGLLVAVGNGTWTGISASTPWVVAVRRRAELDGSLTVFVAVDSIPVGALVLSDPLRADAARTVRNLRRSGIERVVMVTGDRREVADSVGQMLAVDRVYAEQSPADKLDVVRQERRFGQTMMVGDGINDAPALAIADVGVAIGARGSTASSETADIVLTVDRLDRLGEARLIARRSRRIATQSVVAGMGLSVVAMGFAAGGLLPATWGAVLQELIDVAVILNALRALGGGLQELHLDEPGSIVAQHFSAEHVGLHPRITLLRDAAEMLGDGRPEAMETVRAGHRFLVDEVEPHERAEDRDFYPVVAHALGGADPTATMSRTHLEIARMTSQLGIVIERVGSAPAGDADRRDLQRLLYGLYAVLQLHFAQEDENYLSLADDPPL